MARTADKIHSWREIRGHGTRPSRRKPRGPNFDSRSEPGELWSFKCEHHGQNPFRCGILRFIQHASSKGSQVHSNVSACDFGCTPGEVMICRESSSLPTRRWREVDSNFRFRT